MHSTQKVSSTWCTDLRSIFSPTHCTGYHAPCRKKNKHALDNLCGKCLTIVPILSQLRHINLECCEALSHTPGLLQQLFIYRVASNATISSKLPHARSLTRGQIPELFKRHHPSANVLKIFLAHSYNYEIFFTRDFFLRNIFNSNTCIFWFTVIGVTHSQEAVQAAGELAINQDKVRDLSLDW